MNKRELIDRCSKKTRDNKIDAEKYVDAVLETLSEALVSGEVVKLVGFGKFEVKTRKGRTGRNPKKPEETYVVPESKGVFFTPGKPLKDAINK